MMRDHLALALAAAVPLEIARLRSLPEEERAREIKAHTGQAVAVLLGEHGDDLLFGGRHCAAAFAALATGLACLARGKHYGAIGNHFYVDDGTRLARSVQKVPSVRGGLHPTEKPVPLLDKLIRYACPPGGLVIDPFAGSGSTLEAARLSGRRVIGVEVNEEYAERAAKRLCQAHLDFGEVAS